jgi:thiol-disulfide isomerase/thioredoxin
VNDDVPAGRSPRRTRYLWAALALVVASAAAVVVAVRADPERTGGEVDPAQLAVGPAAPELAAAGWLNSPALDRAALRDKVVLYDFWTYSCVNCVRTLPYLRSWYQRYQGDGLTVVGVHSPEFAFEKDHGNVAAAVKRLGVTWPVALDDDMAIWNRFSNLYWPAKYVTDRQGRIRYFHPGEGRYRETEDVLRTLLGVDPSSPRAPSPEEARRSEGEEITPETYLGTERGRAAVGGVRHYPEPAALGQHDAALVGSWEADGERVTSREAGASILLDYRAREVNLVMAATAPMDVVVELDGDPGRRTVVRVDASDLYRLALGSAVERHRLRLTAPAPGLSAYAFTFGS